MWNGFGCLFFDTIFSWPLIMFVRRKQRIAFYEIEDWVFLNICFYFKITQYAEITLGQNF